MTNTKKILQIVPEKPVGWVGDGLPVHGSIGPRGLGKILNPFILLDYGAPYEFQPYFRPRGVGMHPHRGFETVTIAFQGEITHADSTGATDTIYPGDVQWMTAGSGIEHSEMHSDNFTRTGGMLEMLQLWVNLPSKDKMSKPGYQAITAKDIPAVKFEQGTANIIAGKFNNEKGPASTFTTLSLISFKLNPGTKATLPIPENWVGAILMRRGDASVDGEKVGPKDLIAFDREGSNVDVSTEEGAEFVFMAGEPIDEPIAAYGPMVMNTQEEITEAFRDYQAGKFSGN